MRSQRHIDAIVVFGPVSVIRRLGPQVVRHTKQTRFDVVEPAKFLAPVGQPWIHGQWEAVGVEVCRRHRHILGDQKAAVPGAEITHIERHAAPQLAIHSDGCLPVVKLFVEAALRIVCDTSIAGSHLTE